jgi:Rrf2 family transcriptional regulator, nitric oxide-sensitive transcriptional repressor
VQLTRFTDYALRVLIFVGRQDGRICTMGEIALHYRISKEHLRKVIHKLAKLGYLDSRRGRAGGIVLSGDAASLRIGDVVLAMEEDLSIVDCHALDCVLLPGCSLKAALDRGSHAFIATLNEVTLADLLHNPQMKQQLKRIEFARSDGPRRRH